MPTANALDRLQHWYLTHCDGGWEHSYGVEISTLDNPGWRLKIALEDTDLKDKPFERLQVERSDDDWVSCWVADLIFEAACGPLNLTEAIELFLEWAEAPGL